MTREDPDFLDAVEKAMRVIQAFSATEPALRITRVAELTGLTRATARRLLLTFERLGFVESNDGLFRLTPRVLRIGYSYLSSLPFAEHIQGELRSLAEEFNESCSAATLDGEEIVYVARVPANRSMTITLAVGSRLPAYPTSMGRVLLAGLSDEALEEYFSRATIQQLTAQTVTNRERLRAIIAETQSNGFAIVDGEREEGVRSAAAPIRASTGQVLAAINISVNAARIPLEYLQESIVPRLKATAAEISRNLDPISLQRYPYKA
jgi:IclR family transcriptional regulator, pca regulon regulatory protein